jgi:VanZ family protein
MKVPSLVSKWMPVLAWMLLIFAGSSDALSAEHTSRFLVPFLLWLDPHISFSTIAAIHLTVRKMGHFTEYAILAALLWRGMRGTFAGASGGLLALATLVLAGAFAASDEFHQSFVPSRTASPYDVMIDCTGALFAIAWCALLAARRQTVLVTADRKSEN